MDEFKKIVWAEYPEAVANYDNMLYACDLGVRLYS
jgi:hypothetical protein